HRARHRGRDDLDHADRVLRALDARAVERGRGRERQQPRLLDLAARARDRLQYDALRRERLAERDARVRALDHRLERALREPDQPHAMVDAPRAEPALRDLEAAAFAE